MKKLVLALFLLSSFAYAGIDDFRGYYKFTSKVLLKNSTSKKLKESLYKDIREHEVFSYKKARAILFGELHLKNSSKGHKIEDVYCQKSFGKEVGVGPGKIPQSNYLNCEHTWPQSRFNSNMSKTAQKTDLHHLYPTDSRANSSRGNLIFGEVNGRAVNSSCVASQRGEEYGSGTTAFQPPRRHRGNVARALFYFSIRYKISISQTEEDYLREWHRDDPVDAHERQRNNRIADLQGNRNPFIDDSSLVEQIADF